MTTLVPGPSRADSADRRTCGRFYEFHAPIMSLGRRRRRRAWRPRGSPLAPRHGPPSRCRYNDFDIILTHLYSPASTNAVTIVPCGVVVLASTSRCPKRRADWRAFRFAGSNRRLQAIGKHLSRPIAPDLLSSREGPGGSKLVYVEGWKVPQLANKAFGFNGWSSSIQRFEVRQAS